MSSKFRSLTNRPAPVVQNIEGPSLTQQHYAAETDVNKMVKRHMKGGIGRNLHNIGTGASNMKPIFGDFTAIDYHDMLNAVSNIENTFNRLPARVRARFRNNPELAVDFANDPANLKEAVKMGLVTVPEGMVMTEEGNLVDQMDVVKEAAKASVTPPAAAPKPDEEANPTFKKGGEK